MAETTPLLQDDPAVEEQPLILKEDQIEWKTRMNTLLRGAILSGFLVRQDP